MALLTTAQQLEEVQSAITAVMSGQAYDIAGRRMTRANLQELTDREELLIKRIKRDGNEDYSTSTVSAEKAVFIVNS